MKFNTSKTTVSTYSSGNYFVVGEDQEDMKMFNFTTPDIITYPAIQMSDNIASLIHKFCDDTELKEELNEVKNLHLKQILETILLNLELYLDDTISNNYGIDCYKWRDIELENWEKIVIEVRSAFDDFEEYETFWDELIRIKSEAYKRYLERVNMSESDFEQKGYRAISVILENTL